MVMFNSCCWIKNKPLPTTIHCDHLIRVKVEGEMTCEFLWWKQWSFQIFRISPVNTDVDFETRRWNNSSGCFENYIPRWINDWNWFSHSQCRRLGMIAVGVGGVDAAETMAECLGSYFTQKIGVILLVN